MTWERNTTGLTSYKPTWNHGATKTIRVPIALADAVLEYARALDSGLETDTTADTTSTTTPETTNIPNDAIALILTKIDQKLSGYRSNSAGKLIKDLRDL